MAHDVVIKGIQLAVSGVIKRGILLSALEHLDRGEASDAHTGHFVFGRVNLGDHNILVVLQLFSQLGIDRGKLLAVSAPGGVKFNQHILVLVVDHLAEVFADQHANAVFVTLGRDFFRLEERFLGSGLHGIHKLTHGLRAHAVLDDLLVIELDHNEKGLSVGGNAQELAQASSETILDLSGTEEDLALVFGGIGVEDFLLFGHFFGIEEEEGGALAREDSFGGLLVKAHHQGVGFHSNELFDLVFIIQFALVHSLVILEVLVKDDRGLALNRSVVKVMHEELIFLLRCHLQEFLEISIVGAPVGNHDRVGFLFKSLF